MGGLAGVGNWVSGFVRPAAFGAGRNLRRQPGHSLGVGADWKGRQVSMGLRKSGLVRGIL